MRPPSLQLLRVMLQRMLLCLLLLVMMQPLLEPAYIPASRLSFFWVPSVFLGLFNSTSKTIFLF